MMMGSSTAIMINIFSEFIIFLSVKKKSRILRMDSLNIASESVNVRRKLPRGRVTADTNTRNPS